MYGTKKTIFASILIIFGWILPANCNAEKLYVDRIGLEQGLSQNQVTSIVQDSKGFMWFGTQTALNRYDGYEFKYYTEIKNNTSSIRGNNVWALLVDKKNQLWVGTYAGLNLYNADNDNFKHYLHDPEDPHSLSHQNVWALLDDSQGFLWVGTGRGLNRLDQSQQKFTHFFHDEADNNSLSSNAINALFQDRNGDIWVGTDRGLNRYDAGQQQFDHFYDKKLKLASSIVTTIAEDNNGQLWIGTHGNGIFLLDHTRTTLSQITHNPKNKTSISTNNILKIIKDSKNQIWIGTDNGGLNRWDAKSNHFIHYQNNPNDPHSLSENVIFSMYEDRHRIFWLGTYTKGISKFNPYGFNSTLEIEYQSLDNLDPLTDIRAFLVDRQGALWVGSSSNGIRVKLADGRKISLKHDPNDPKTISSNSVYCMFEDSDGTVWVGTEAGWLNEFNRHNNTFTRYKIQAETPGSIRHGLVLRIQEDRRGLLWIGLERGGAHSFNRKTKEFVHYHHDPNDKNTISDNRIFDLQIGQNDDIWFATHGSGLSHFNQTNKTFTQYQSKPNNDKSPTQNYISIIHKDYNKNILWLGLDGAGLDKFDLQTKTFTNFNSQHGLADSNIYGITQNENGHLWISHNKGLSFFNTNTQKFKNYEQSDGLQSNEFNGGADYRSPDGKIYLGGIAGYNAFYTDQIIDNPHKPPVYITDFQLFNKPVGINEKFNNRILLNKSITESNALTLSYRDSVFSFEFAALDYALSAKNQYAYRMQGLEDDWNYVDSRRRYVTYTTLPPGDYIFKVKASNNHGVWNEDGVSLPITITPPFWKTTWFRLIVIASILLITYCLYTLRIRAIQARNKMLKREVKTRTAELEDTLLELGNTKDALIDAAHKAGMADTAIAVLHNVGNILNNVNTSAGLIRDTISQSVTNKFFKATKLISDNKDNLKEFMLNNPKAESILLYYVELVKSFKSENTMLQENATDLINNIASITEVVSAQQQYATQNSDFVESHSLLQIVDDTLLLQASSISRHGITLEKFCDNSVPNIPLQKIKLVQILINLYKNAKESMDSNKSNNNILKIEITQDNNHAYIKVSDTGLGIEKNNLKLIFSHGYTTKSNGHGFGLHSCANYMTEMKGKIWAESEGLGKGATFVLQFPLKNKTQEIASAA